MPGYDGGAFLDQLTTYYTALEDVSFFLSLSVNPFMPTVPTFAVRETCVSRHNGGAAGAPLKPLRDDSAMRALYRL